MFVALLVLFALVPPVFASGYRGVEIGQRDDFLPPEFDQVLRGEYDAQFGKESIQAFVDGALVTGIKVVPLAPMTLAEALGGHSPGLNAGDLRLLLDLNGGLLGIVDVVRQIAYFVSSVAPESVVAYVGYYNQQTALMIFTRPLPSDKADELVTAASRSSAQALQRRPPVKGLAEQADYLVQQAIVEARRRAQDAARALRRLERACHGNVACGQSRRDLVTSLINATSDFLRALQNADRMYLANANLLGNAQPPDLSDLQDFSDQLMQQIRTLVGRTAPETGSSAH
jgi:hypothetical protein